MIPVEAVEAAAKAMFEEVFAPNIWVEEDEIYKNQFRDSMRRALDAAAPYIRAQALEDAAGALELQPPKLRAQYVETRRLYAADPWRLTTCPSECAATNHPGAEHGSNE